MGLEEILKHELGTKRLDSHGSGGGGCISSGQGYVTDTGKIFVKMNAKAEVGATVLVRSPPLPEFSRFDRTINKICILSHIG